MPSTALALNNLASIAREQGDLAGALSLCEHILARVGSEPLNVMRTLRGWRAIAVLLQALQGQDELGGARPSFERALAIAENALGPEHFLTSHTRTGYARMLLAVGDRKGSEERAEAALAVQEKALGPEHPWTADSARVTADALAALGRTEDAAALRARYGLQPE